VPVVLPPFIPSPSAANGHQHDHVHPPALPSRLGQLAPALKLPDLDSRVVDLADLRGASTLVLFWNPGCGFCQQMLPELKTWEAERPPTSPRILVVSTGTVEANQALGLQSPVLLDQDFSAGRAFNANGTPMAVLVDADGKIASEVAAGAPAVMALARNGQP
jgi:thiol-disulfide isomerase/thioredoxin